MSGSEHKASQRHLRRAFGPDAVDALNAQAKKILSLEETITNQRKLIDKALNDYAELRTQRDTDRADADRRMKTAEQLTDGFLTMPFRARLRWMVKGK